MKKIYKKIKIKILLSAVIICLYSCNQNIEKRSFPKNNDEKAHLYD